MGKITFYFLSMGILLVLSCKSFHLSDNSFDLFWKSTAITKLIDKYPHYWDEMKRDSCLSRPDIDLYLKVHEINSSPIGEAFKKVKGYCKKNNIVPDSIYFIYFQWLSDPDPSLKAPSHYYLFSSSKLTVVEVSMENINDRILLFDMDYSTFRKVYDIKEGCDLSLIVFTKIYKNWNWDIVKVVINSERFVNTERQ